MRILSITAQKPCSTGSGVYLSELVREFAEKGHEQAVVAGIYDDDIVELPQGVAFHPVYFKTDKLPFPITGMSDEMPYESTRYCDLTPDMVEQFREAFLTKIETVVEELNPDLILCHHLYLLTAMVREHFPDRKIYGFCHNTDLRQMQKHGLEENYIKEKIRGLDRIFVPQTAQRDGVMEIYDAEPSKITIVGMGYNSKIFRPADIRKDDGVTRLVFAGKIAEKKGVMSLIRSLSYLDYEKEKIQVLLAGSAGNETEYGMICRLAKEAPYEVVFLGRLEQQKLSEIYNACDIFVLPSFFDGLPLTVIEALACGDRVVMTDLPGIREWIGETVPGADVSFVELPQMRNTDEAVEDSLPDFEKRLAETLRKSIEKGCTESADVSRISWANIAEEVLR